MERFLQTSVDHVAVKFLRERKQAKAAVIIVPTVVTIEPDYTSVPESALLALGKLILERGRLQGIPCTSRRQAIAVIRSIKNN